jgi:hypothetical protein
VTPAELLALLQEFHRETLDLVRTRQANVRSVGAYDSNNAYQQVLGRQEIHLQWLSDAIKGLGGVAAEPAPAAEMDARAEDNPRSLIEGDRQSQSSFIDRWAPRPASITNARHRKILELILGEMSEHLRLFEQALEGRSDLLGRHADGKVLRGAVLPFRPRN